MEPKAERLGGPWNVTGFARQVEETGKEAAWKIRASIAYVTITTFSEGRILSDEDIEQLRQGGLSRCGSEEERVAWRFGFSAGLSESCQLWFWRRVLRSLLVWRMSGTNMEGMNGR